MTTLLPWSSDELLWISRGAYQQGPAGCSAVTLSEGVRLHTLNQLIDQRSLG